MAGVFWIMRAPWKAGLEATTRPENQAFRETLQGAWAWQKTVIFRSVKDLKNAYLIWAKFQDIVFQRTYAFVRGCDLHTRRLSCREGSCFSALAVFTSPDIHLASS